MFEYDEFGNAISPGGKGGFYNPQSSFGTNTGYQSFAAPNQYITGASYTPPANQWWNPAGQLAAAQTDRKSTRLNSSHRL